MSQFVFDKWEFDKDSRIATFRYSFTDSNFAFTERVSFVSGENGYDDQALTRALDLAHLLIGTSYFKAFPTPEVDLRGSTSA